MALQIEPFPTDVFFAQIDRAWAIQDYAPGLDCIRLIGVSESSFRHGLFNTLAGCQTYIIDLGRIDFQRSSHHFPSPYADLSDPRTPEFDEGPAKLWIEIRFVSSAAQTPSYAYAAFSDAEPSYLSVQSVTPAAGPAVQPLTQGAPAAAPPVAPGQPVELIGFHVGQGMCSLFHGGGVGYLLDAGAGVPVLRPEYRRGSHAGGRPFVNELRPLVSALSSMTVIVSHSDSDHWRLLDWDHGLLTHSGVVYLPAGQPALAFSAPAIKPKVIGLGNTTFTLNGSNSVELLRSIPRRSDPNGECLVALVDCNGNSALLAGDYVYSRMLTDANANVSGSAAQSYHAIVVPHHGDTASAGNVPAAAVAGTSIAYFSAGTHRGYGHPKAASITAHQGAGFAAVNKNTTDDVLKLQLL